MTHTPLRPATNQLIDDVAPAAPKYAKWPWLAGGIVLAALGVGTYVFFQNDQSASSVSSVAQETTVTDGTFAFRVTDLKCGVAEVGPTALAARATGEFCLVSVAVRNVGKEPDLLDPSVQRAVDSTGHEFSVSDHAAAFVNVSTPTLLEQIPPGETVSGVLPFDVPSGTRLSAILLHGSAGSAGVRVPLS